LIAPAPIAAPKQMADLTPQQRANLEATVASQQRIATAIVAMPRDRRAAGIAKARRIFEDTVKEYGIDSSGQVERVSGANEESPATLGVTGRKSRMLL
jgi:hypothetical protein